MKFFFLLVTVALMVTAPALAQQPGGPSWLDRGNAAIRSGEIDSAKHYLRKWVQADPSDHLAWYNLACAEALSGNTEAALEAWEAAVVAGWDDPKHPLEDPDLQQIRATPRFLAALDSVESNLARMAPANFRRHFLDLSTTGTYVVLLPEGYDEASDREYPLFVILHGSGSTELAHGRLADRLNRTDVLWIVPRAPHVHTSAHVGSGRIGYTAWTPDEIDSLDPYRDRVPAQYANWILSCIEDARSRYRTSSTPARLLGHSQGAAFAWITATTRPEAISALYSYAGYYPPEFMTEEVLRTVQASGVRVHIAHGESDAVVSPDQSRQFHTALSSAGIKPTAHFFDDVGHGIAPEVLESMATWVAEELQR